MDIEEVHIVVEEEVTEVHIVVSDLVEVPVPTVKEGITAFAGGGQEEATVLNSVYNLVEIVATPGDSCKLDGATKGKLRDVVNLSDNDMDLFPAEGEKFINATTDMGEDTPIVVGAGNGIIFKCFAAGVWRFY